MYLLKDRDTLDEECVTQPCCEAGQPMGPRRCKVPLVVQCGRGGLALKAVLPEERVDIRVMDGLWEVRVEAVLERCDGIGGGEDGGHGGRLGGVFPLFERGREV